MTAGHQAEPTTSGLHREAVYDVFFSYSWDNMAEALILVAALEERSLRVFRDETGMRDYDDIGTEVLAALAGSRSVVALYTPQFPESAYCRLELALAMTAAYRLDGDVRRIFPVVREIAYEAVRPRVLQDKRLPVRSAGAGALAAAVAERLGEIDDRPLGAAPEPRSPTWYPFPTVAEPSFHGRATELWDLHDALAGRDDAAKPGQQLARVVGMGGQGKTMLVEQYARWFAADHPGGVFVLRGFGSHRDANASPALLKTALDKQLVRIADCLPGHRTRDGSADRPAEAVIRDHLERLDQDYLWIVDDLPDELGLVGLRGFLAPTARGRTLMTSRHRHRGFVGETVDLGPLAESAAVGILLGRADADRPTIASARRLAADLGHHPMAIALVARTLDGSNAAEFERVRGQLAAPDVDALEWAAAQEHEIATDHQGSVAAAMMRSLTRLSPMAQEVLLLASILAAAPIPVALFETVLAGTRRFAASSPAVTVDGALQECSALALAVPTAGESGPLWSVHALISRAVRFRDRFQGHRERLRAEAVEALGQVLEDSRDESPLSSTADYLPHVRTVVGAAAELPERSLLNEAGRVQISMGAEREALEMFDRLYRTCKEMLGEEDIATQAGLVGLGAAYGLLGQHERALELKTRAHEVLSRIEGPDEEATLIALNNVAITLGDLGEHERARALHRQIYSAHRRRRGPSHRATLSSLGAYATSCAHVGRRKLALRLRTDVLAASRRYLRPDDPQLADAIDGLAFSHQRAGDMPEARRLFQEAYDVRRSVQGPSHPDTLTALELAAICADPETRAAELRVVYRERVACGDPGSPAARRTLRNLVVDVWAVHEASTSPGSSRSEGRGIRSAPLGEPPGDWTDVAVRLDDETVDQRVGVFQSASYLHDALVAEFGTDHPLSLFVEVCLGHAAVCLGQMDRQIDDGLVLLRDAAEGMRVVPGCSEEDLLTAERLVDWGERLTFEE